MENLKESIYESLRLDESLNSKDIDKMDSIMFSKQKLKSYIKKHESDITEMGLGSSDIEDIMSIMEIIHSYVVSSQENDLLDKLSDFFEDGVEDWIFDNIEGEDDSWVDISINLYKTLFKELTNKNL